MSDSAIPAFFNYWGKARSHEESMAWHLLPSHGLDVAAVGLTYLQRAPAMRRACCQLLDCDEADFLSWTAFFLALHDLGKFSEAFQAQRPDLILELQKRAPHPGKSQGERHDSLGYWLWNDDLVEDGLLAELGIDDSPRIRRGLKCWLQAMSGHHGMPPKPAGTVDFYFRRQDKQAARVYVTALATLLLTDGARRIPQRTGADFEAYSKLLSWWLAGIAVLADWLGSNTNFFAYQTQPTDLGEYWRNACARATCALEQSGVLPVAVEAGKALSDFFPYITQPSPLQQWAATVPLSSGPQIHLLEDVTGAGKTEAALMLAYRLMAQGGADGFFIGLPTMATANAMYARVAHVYRHLFAGDANLVLAHGFRTLVDEFAASVLPATSSENDAVQGDETASARCSAWLADHGKRALLASAGVGTVDQALLAVLHSKHQSLRLLGLFNKVLIIDEVHACDAYMQGVLEVLLQFHARTGGAVILLSATLPSNMKQALLDAYAQGRNQAHAPRLAATAYPLATCWQDGHGELIETPMESRLDVARTVCIHYEPDQEKIFAHIEAAVRQGQCVGWIRNTVHDATAAYARLAGAIAPEQLTLFHARFALGDRLACEARVLDAFGSASTPEQRHGRVMLATQVAEQSLDVDFDVLITDLAPIDRVLQRAGRLQRHRRDARGKRLKDSGVGDGRAAPCLWVHGPQWTVTPKADWYGALFDKGQYVYRNHGQLWLTARMLQRDAFSMPADARSLIEAVFSGTESLPDGLARSDMQAQGKEISEASLAQQNTLKLDGGYQRGDLGDWWNDAMTPSRLGEETIEVMLAKWEGDQLTRWAQGAWAYSMVKLPARLLAAAEPPAGAEQAYQQMLATLPAGGKWCVLLPLSRRADGVWAGQGWTAAGDKGKKPAQRLAWLYDVNFGLRIDASHTGDISE